MRGAGDRASGNPELTGEFGVREKTRRTTSSPEKAQDSAGKSVDEIGSTLRGGLQ